MDLWEPQLVKRTIFLLCVVIMVVLIPSEVYCLDSVLGVKVGVGHFSYMGRDYRDGLESGNLQNAFKLGYAAGLFFTIKITSVLAIQPEILVIGTGDAYKEEASLWDAVLWGPYYGQVKYIDRITYAALPVLVKTQFGRMSFSAGPTLLLHVGKGKLCLRADDEWLQYDLESVGWDSMEYLDGVFAPFVFAAAAGAGIEFPIGRRGGVLLLEARGHYVFTNVLDESQGQDFQAYGIMIMAGYGVDSRGRKLIQSRVR